MEVVIAIAIVAGGAVTILALLPSVARRSTEAQETQAALGLADATRIELQRLALERGFDSLASSVTVLDGTQDTGLLLVAARGSAEVRVLATESPARDQYFLVELRRYPSGQLAYEASAAFLALSARVSWPYRSLRPDGLSVATAATERQHVDFSVLIQR